MPPRKNVNHRDLRDVEIDDLRRQVQQLQEELARVKVVNEEDEVHDDDSDGEEEYDNPFGSSSASDSGHSSHQHRRVRRSRHDFDFKVDIPEFDGKIQPDEFLDWLHTVEKVFDFKEVSEDRKVKLVAIKLRKHAGLWWENLKMRRVREGRKTIRTWEKMKRELKRRFLPENYRQDSFLKFHNLKQQDKSAEEYTSEFDHLMIKCDIVEPEEQTIARYLGGLWSEISNVVQLQPYWTYADVCKLAVKVEKQQKEKRGSFTRSFNKEGSTSSGKTPVIAPKVPVKNDKQVVGSSSNGARKCFKCQGYGHIASECPNRKVITLMEEDIIEESALEVDVSHIEEVVYPDEGEALGQSANLNMSSCSNVVATSMVEKLQLKTEDHPRACIEKKMFVSQMGYVLVVMKESRSQIVEHNPLVRTILEEFKDVIPNEIPTGLPPMREVTTCHDLKGVLQENKSPCAVPALLLPKKDGSWRMCVDSRAINRITIKYRFPIPRLDDLLDQLFGAMVFSKIDLRTMPFGLSNAHSTFMRAMTQIFRPLMEKCVVVLLDRHLGYIVTSTRIEVDHEKVEAILNWPVPKNIHDVRSFHGLVSFYRRFIRDFSTLVTPITECLKGSSFQWTKEAQKTFDIVKRKMAEAPVLVLPDFEKIFEVECDASNVGIGGVLSQGGKPVAFFSEKLNDAKRKYTTYDKEFYAIVRTLEHWSHYLLPNEFVLFFYSRGRLWESSQKLEKKNIREWDLQLAHAEFAYNHSISQTTSQSPFEVVYGLNPITPLDLAPIETKYQFSGDAEERIKFIKKLHEEVNKKLCRKMKSTRHELINIGSMSNLMRVT
ncbi:putative CCCH-type zinc finger family protein [Tanacetum coccineum]